MAPVKPIGTEDFPTPPTQQPPVKPIPTPAPQPPAKP